MFFWILFWFSKWWSDIRHTVYDARPQLIRVVKQKVISQRLVCDHLLCAVHDRRGAVF